MEIIQKNQFYHIKKSKFIQAFTLLFMSMLVSSCEIIGGIFKAGMGFGIFIVVIVVVGIVYLIRRLSKKE